MNMLNNSRNNNTIVFLDIDNTLLEFDHSTDTASIRPYAKEFIQRLMDDRIDVGIFTAGDSDYALHIIRTYFADYEFDFKYVFSRVHCLKVYEGTRVRRIKDFNYLQQFYPALGEYKSIFLVDDKPENIRPEKSAIGCQEYFKKNHQQELQSSYFQGLYEKHKNLINAQNELENQRKKCGNFFLSQIQSFLLNLYNLLYLFSSNDMIKFLSSNTSNFKTFIKRENLSYHLKKSFKIVCWLIIFILLIILFFSF